MKSEKLLYILFFLPWLMCACSDVQGKLLIMEGNSLNTQGRFNEAIEPYMKSLEFEEAAPFGEYGLGTIFFALGEDNASLDRLNNAQNMIDNIDSPSRELRYRIHYNTGVVLFSERDFSGAADSFRDALRADGSNINAKRNLELSLLSLERDRSSSVSMDDSDSDADIESQAAFFEFIRQRELNQWRNMEWPEEEAIGPDY